MKKTTQASIQLYSMLCGEEQNYALKKCVSKQFNNYTNGVGLFSCCDIAR